MSYPNLLVLCSSGEELAIGTEAYRSNVQIVLASSVVSQSASECGGKCRKYRADFVSSNLSHIRSGNLPNALTGVNVKDLCTPIASSSKVLAVGTEADTADNTNMAKSGRVSK